MKIQISVLEEQADQGLYCLPVHLRLAAHLCIVNTNSSIFIGVGRFRILGGQGLEYWGGGQGRAKFQQAHDVVMTSMRCNDVASTSFRRHMPKSFLINQCQITTFLILISDIENSRIEMRVIVHL